MSIKIPFTKSLTSGDVIPYWERNDWYRAHGYQRPWDKYMLFQWLASFTVDVGFFCFLGYFLDCSSFIKMMEISSLGESAAATAVAAKTSSSIVSWPLSAWSWKIMAGFSAGVKVVSVITSFIPTEDPVVASQRGAVPRSKTYVRRLGIPVIDSSTRICGICRIKV